MSYQDPNQQGQYPNAGGYGGYNPTPNSGQPQATDPYSGQQYGQQGGYQQGGNQQYGQPPYGQAQQGGYQQYGQTPYGQPGAQNAYGSNLGPTSMNMDPKLAGALSYITWIGGLVFFLAEKQNRFVRFHAIQSLILWLGFTVLNIVLSIIRLGFLGGLLWLVVLIGAIVAGVNAYQGKLYKLPLIGDYAERYANQQGPTL